MATNNSIDNKVTSGNFTVTAGNILLPTTSSTVGQITINSVAFLHGYGTANIFAGGAGNLTLTSTNCVCIGSNAGHALTSGGVDSIIIGYNACSAATSLGNTSVIIGSGAAAGGGSGSYQVIVGYQAGSLISGNASILLGYQSGYKDTGCGGNVAIGFRSAYGSGSSGNAYANYNTFIGYETGYKINDAGGSGNGYVNCCVGARTGYNLTTGYANLFLGLGDRTNLYGAGYDCGATSTGNIMIHNIGVAGDAGVCRIGDNGVSPAGPDMAAITKTFISGIYNFAGTMDAANAACTVDRLGQLQAARSFAASPACKTLSILKSRGSINSPTVITSGDALGIFDFRGHDGTGYIAGATIESTNSGTVATNRIAANLVFKTHPDSTTAATTRMTIAPTGEITVAAPDSGTALTVTGDVSATTVFATTFDTNVAAAGVTLAGTTLAADGSDTDINITLTPKGAGTVVSAAVYSKQVTSNVRAVLVDDGGLFGNVTSSIRFKDNVEDMGIDSSKIFNLRPVTFTYKADDKKKKQFGLIAEEVEKVMPLLVSYDSDGLPHSVNYHDLPQILLNEIQKMAKRIEALEKKLKEK